MKIVFAGRVTLRLLADFGKWDRPLPEAKWGFPLGSEIVKRLVGRGHTVVVVTEHTVDKVERFKCQTECGGLEVWLVPSWKRSRWMFLTLFSKEMRGIRAAIQEIKPDVVFAQWTYHNAYAGLTSGYPTLVVAHDSPWRIVMVEKNLQTLIRALYAQFFVFPKVRHMTTVSPYIVSELRNWNRFKGEVKVVPNGIAHQDGIYYGSHTLIRKQATTVVCVSDWSARKNVKTLFRALVCAGKRLPHLHAIVFGNELSRDGEAGKYLRKHQIKINCLELRGLTPRTEIDRVLREEADLFVSPSLEESFGMVFVEAMRFGVPCIGGEKSGAVPWVIGDGGAVCDVTKPQKLAECIEHVMCDAELRKKLSECGRKRVREMFDIEKVVDMYESELKKVAGC